MEEMIYPKVHLTGSSLARRSSRAARGFALYEKWEPAPEIKEALLKRGATAEVVFSLLNWLDVEISERYQRAGQQTFCNIYVYDFLYLISLILGKPYLPHVWWKDSAIREMDKGKVLIPKYSNREDGNITELNANALFDWLIKYSHLYGWKKVEEEYDAQDLVNAGNVGIVCAKNRIGHVTVILPEWNNIKGKNDRNGKKMLLQSQAGWENKKVFSDRWYLDMKEYGFWVNV